MEYEWDEAKRFSNLAKHGVDFPAVAAFEWDTAIRFEDSRRAYGEQRGLAHRRIGTRLHVLVFTHRGSRVRMISLRKANDKEIDDYETATGA